MPVVECINPVYFSEKYVIIKNMTEQKPKILMVDDEPDQLNSFKNYFSRRNVLVFTASSGEEALALVETLHPDVVLMDIALPRMDGVAATQALHTTFPQLAVIILTIHNDKATQVRARAAGAAAFVTKRGLNGELLAAIRRVSNRPEGRKGKEGGPLTQHALP